MSKNKVKFTSCLLCFLNAFWQMNNLPMSIITNTDTTAVATTTTAKATIRMAICCHLHGDIDNYTLYQKVHPFIFVITQSNVNRIFVIFCSIVAEAICNQMTYTSVIISSLCINITQQKNNRDSACFQYKNQEQLNNKTWKEIKHLLGLKQWS